MKWFEDLHHRRVRLTYERQQHLEADHPEIFGQIGKIQEALLNPDMVVRSKTDSEVELFYRHYRVTPVPRSIYVWWLKY